MTIAVNTVQLAKARLPIDVTELGIATAVNPSHSFKAPAPIEVTESEITNRPSLSGGQPYSPSHGGMFKGALNQEQSL